MSTFKSAALVLLAIPVLVSCGSFRGDPMVQVAKWPPDIPQQKKTISLSVGLGMFQEKPEKRMRHYIPYGRYCWTADPNIGTIGCKDFKEVGETTLGMETHGHMSIRAFRESGLFSEVKTDGSSADIEAKVRVLLRTVPSSGAMVTAFTLFLIPGKMASHEMTVMVTFKDKDGRIIEKQKKAEVDGATWAGFPVLFALPFRHSSFDEAEYDITRSIIVEAHQKGII